jgi:hypothetical protein
MINQEIAYNNNTALIYAGVWEAHRRNPATELDEILGQANELFVGCCHRWNQGKKATFSTYLTRTLKRALPLREGPRKYEVEIDPSMEVEDVGVNGTCGPERRVIVKDLLEKMSPLAVEVVNLIFDPPRSFRELMRRMGEGGPSKKLLRVYLKEIGIYEDWLITKTFNEIKGVLKEV